VILPASAASAVSAEETPPRVLILYSYGPDTEPYAEYAAALRRHMARELDGRIEFFQASLETSRFPETDADASLAAYLETVLERRRVDLVISLGAAAAGFCKEHRESLLPETPLLVAAIASRAMPEGPPPRESGSIAVSVDVARVVEEILRLLPETRTLAMVLGSSALERFWVEQLQQDLAPFADRLELLWLHELSLPEMAERLARLPPDSAVFYGMLAVDAAGVPQGGYYALERLHEVSSAPIFGLFESQLGDGIVGGPLLSLREAGRRAGGAALRILTGADPASIREPPLEAELALYDFRELRRWRIPEARLRRGATVLYRPQSFWGRYGTLLAVASLVVSAEALLIAALLAQRRRRRRVEEEARSLARRLLRAHEDERRRLALELHDDLSQRMARLAIDTALLEKPREGGSTESTAREIRQGLNRLSEDLHSLSYRLHPAALENLGLSDALGVECDLFSRREGIEVELVPPAAPVDPPREAALCLFRIAQEALTNIAHHARASHVVLAVSELDGGIEITVSDDGVGFEASHASSRPSLGLAGMRERALAVNGRVEIRSRRHHGTTVRAWVPSGDSTP
jgi:signal transduction histidine kinase